MMMKIPNALDFVKKMQYSYYSRDALAKVAQDVALFARKEGLTAHANAVKVLESAKAKKPLGDADY